MSNTEPVIPETKHVHTCVEPMQVLSNQIEQLQTQLAGCLTAAEGWAGTDWNRESYGWSPAFQATIELHERMTKAEADLAAARENASQNADRYLACEKRFEEAIAQRDAANLRVEGLEKERDKANLDANTLDAENNLLRNQALIGKDWYEHQIAIVNGANLELEARVEQLSRPVRKPKGTVVYENPDGSADRMDRECIQICDAMNGLPGIETISSCCGHGFQPFRIYFVAEFLDDLRPLMELIDESEIWRMRCSMATGNMEIYFILESAHGWLDAYVQADELAKLIRARSERSSQ